MKNISGNCGVLSFMHLIYDDRAERMKNMVVTIKLSGECLEFYYDHSHYSTRTFKQYYYSIFYGIQDKSDDASLILIKNWLTRMSRRLYGDIENPKLFFENPLYFDLL